MPTLSRFNPSADASSPSVTPRNWPSTPVMQASELTTDAASLFADASALTRAAWIAVPMTLTFSAMRRPVSPDIADSLRTSCASTPKPRPLSPAWAASIAALMASRLVWAAMFATSAAICCSSSTKRFRFWTSVCMAPLLAIAPRSESSTLRSAWLLCSKTPTRPCSPPCADAFRAWSSRSTMAPKRCDNALMATSIWARESSIWALQTGSRSRPSLSVPAT